MSYEPRSTHQIRTDGNRLASERSLYLRQHGHNPIDWFAWGEEARLRAKSEDKPIFLSIGYASCHWCHVMEKEVFEVDAIAAFMNDHFVCIKVDREERPDLDAVYMEAVQRLTGGGGWPMSVFLTPTLRPFYGGTYFPPEQFLLLAERIDEVFRIQREDVERQGHSLASAIANLPRAGSSGVPATELLEGAIAQARAQFDDAWGGFRGRMKFPTPIRWHFLLHGWRKTGNEHVGRMCRSTLDAMLAGGIRDHVGGGFHRYTVDPTWLVPHFEKMLYDNAQIANLLLEASAVFNEPRYADAAADTLDFLLREMTDDQGGLFASFDADSGGHEGSYYVWTPEELKAVAGDRDGAVLASVFGATQEGNFEGSNVLTRRASCDDVAAKHAIATCEVEAIVSRWNPALRETRNGRARPGLDRKVVASWNGLALSALASAAQLLENPRWLHAAQQLAAFLLRVHLTPDGHLLRASNEGVAQGNGILDDYANVAAGLIDLHQATGEVQYLAQAGKLADIMIREFALPPLGFALTAKDAEAPLGRNVELFDSVEPSGNASALQVLLRMSALTGDQSLRKIVEETLRSHGDRLRQASLEMSWSVDAAVLLEGPLYLVVIAGDASDPRTQALTRAFHKLDPSHAVLVRVPAEGAGDSLAKLSPPCAGKTAIDGVPAAYVCEHGTCQRPTVSPEELRAQLMMGWSGGRFSTSTRSIPPIE